jgi:hypothetical protein
LGMFANSWPRTRSRLLSSILDTPFFGPFDRQVSI